MHFLSVDSMNLYNYSDCKYCTRGRPPLEENCFLGEYGAEIKEKQYEKRARLNEHQDCVYYEFAGIFERIYRRIFFGIPITPNVKLHHSADKNSSKSLINIFKKKD
jgi:hypothetical protein